jgi:hypothetical protein
VVSSPISAILGESSRLRPRLRRTARSLDETCMGRSGHAVVCGRVPATKTDILTAISLNSSTTTCSAYSLDSQKQTGHGAGAPRLGPRPDATAEICPGRSLELLAKCRHHHRLAHAAAHWSPQHTPTRTQKDTGVYVRFLRRKNNPSGAYLPAGCNCMFSATQGRQAGRHRRVLRDAFSVYVRTAR